MRKTIALVLTAMVLCAGMWLHASAQTTVAVGVDFGLLFRAPTDPRPIKIKAGYLRWTNLRGRTSSVVTADSAGVDTLKTAVRGRGKPIAAVVASDSASFARMYGTHQRSWLITVTDTVRSSATANNGRVTFSILDVQKGTARDTTLFISSAGLYCPQFITDSLSAVVAPYDSIRVRDRTIISWTTSQWQ